MNKYSISELVVVSKIDLDKIISLLPPDKFLQYIEFTGQPLSSIVEDAFIGGSTYGSEVILAYPLKSKSPNKETYINTKTIEL